MVLGAHRVGEQTDGPERLLWLLKLHDAAAFRPLAVLKAPGHQQPCGMMPGLQHAHQATACSMTSSHSPLALAGARGLSLQHLSF